VNWPDLEEVTRDGVDVYGGGEARKWGRLKKVGRLTRDCV